MQTPEIKFIAYGLVGVRVSPMIKAREATVAETSTGITVTVAGKGSTAERAAAVMNVTGEGVAAAAAVAGSERDVHVLAQGTGTVVP
jgi:hypothetical protein